MSSLQGKVALVTGGARRLGAAICRALADEGAQVAVHFHHSEADAIGLGRELGGGVFVVRGDLATPQGRECIFHDTLDWRGRIDLLVNNAALFLPDEAADEQQVRAVNLEAPLDLTRRMAEAGGGAVVQVLDSRFRDERPGFAVYMETKRELAASVERCAREYAPALRVNGVAPGPVFLPENVREPAGPMLMERRPSPEDVARAVIFLADSPSITGQILYVDGGQHLLESQEECGTREAGDDAEE